MLVDGFNDLHGFRASVPDDGEFDGVMGFGVMTTRGVGMGTATRVCVDNYEAYPGIFRVSFDSGDVRAAVVLTRPQLEQLRSCVTDSLARDDAVRRRRGGDL